jgi:hypothetical protein
MRDLCNWLPVVGIEKRAHVSADSYVIKINTANINAILISDRDKAALPVHRRSLRPFEYAQCTTDVLVTCAVGTDPGWRPIRMLS